MAFTAACSTAKAACSQFVAVTASGVANRQQSAFATRAKAIKLGAKLQVWKFSVSVASPVWQMSSEPITQLVKVARWTDFSGQVAALTDLSKIPSRRLFDLPFQAFKLDPSAPSEEYHEVLQNFRLLSLMCFSQKLKLFSALIAALGTS